VLDLALEGRQELKNKTMLGKYIQSASESKIARPAWGPFPEFIPGVRFTK
jgi:hypothetical protein